MQGIKQSILELVGHTPLLKLGRIAEGCPAEILVKLECANPGGSVKIRAALHMVLAAEKEGLIQPGGTIVEPTSGNQGVALAMVGAIKGYRVIVVMPDSMSRERRQLAAAYGAQVVLTPASQDVGGAIQKAHEIAAQIAGAWMPDQFSNPHNLACHEETTALEILEQVAGRIDGFVAGVGTGGTLTGVARVLKNKYPAIKVYAVEPKQSPVLTGGQPGPHGIQGIGDGFVPQNLDRNLLDGCFLVDDEQSRAMTGRLAREEGLLVGISSGAALVAALELGRELGAGQRVLTVFPDTGERYFSTGVFDA